MGLSYIVTGLFVALLFVFVFRRRFSGHFWSAAVVAIIGSFIGGLFDHFFDELIRMLTAINGVFNVFPPLIAASLVLVAFSALSQQKDDYGD